MFCTCMQIFPVQTWERETYSCAGIMQHGYVSQYTVVGVTNLTHNQSCFSFPMLSELMDVWDSCVACDQCLPGLCRLSCQHVYCKTCLCKLLSFKLAAQQPLRCCADAKEDEDGPIMAPLITYMQTMETQGTRAGRSMHELEFCHKTLFIWEDWRQDIGGKLWTPGLLMAHFLAYLHDLAAHSHLRAPFENKTVLEFGSGCGVTGLVAAILGARVTFTDLPCVVPNLRLNVEFNVQHLNLPAEHHSVVEHVWGSPIVGLPHGPDILLIADVFYEPQSVPALLHSVKSVCGPDTVIYVAHQCRNNSAMSDFLCTARACGFRVQEMESAALEYCNAQLCTHVQQSEEEGLFTLQLHHSA